MPNDGQPDEKTVRDFCSWHSNLWSDSRAQWGKYDTFNRRTFPVWPGTKEKRPSLRPSTPTSLIDHAVDNLMGFKPKVHRPVYVRRGIEKQRADRIEPWLTAALQASALAETQMVWKQINKHLLLYGYAVLEGPVISWNSRPKEPLKQPGETTGEFEWREAIYKGKLKNWMPFRLRAPHPARILMDPLEKQPPAAVRVSRMKYSEIVDLSVKKMETRRNADLYVIPEGKHDYDTGLVWDYWTEEWHSVMIDGGQMIYAEMNSYGFVPFSHAFAGFGQEPTDLSQSNPSHWAQGILHAIMDSLRAQAQNYSAKHNLLIRASFTPMGTTRDSAEIAAMIDRGAFVGGMKKDDLWVMDTPAVTRWMMAVGEEIEDDIETGSYASQVAGMRQRGVSTVGQQQLLSVQSNKKFIAPSEQMDSLATTGAQNMLALVDVMDRKITIRGAMIGPDDIQHNYAVLATFDQHDPATALQLRNIGLRELQVGVISDEYYAANYAQIEDETGRLESLARMRVRALPGVMRAEEILVSRQEGLRNVLEEIERAELEANRNGMVDAVPSGAGRNG